MITDTSTCRIYRARRLGMRGIEVRIAGQSSYYFWIRGRQDLMAELEAAGFDVATEEVRFP